MKNPQAFEKLRVSPPKGVLLSGPPGTGKTLLARALAEHTGMNFLPVRPPQLLSQFFGEAERAVASLFSKARMSAPTLLFLDEFDAMAPRRSGKDAVLDRIVAQFLMELDGMPSNQGVVVLAATNRAAAIDPALTRPGRFDMVIEFPMPDARQREDILNVHLDGRPRDKAFDEKAFAESLDGMTGADIAALVEAAARTAVARTMRTGDQKIEIQTDDFDNALHRMRRARDDRKKDYIAGRH